MSDLVERLRDYADSAGVPPEGAYDLAGEAAYEIERLNAEVTHYAQAYHREMVANKKLQAENERLTALREEDREDMQRLSDQLDYLSDENAKLQALIPPSRPVVICADCKSLEAALTRIATMPPVNEEFGYQGYDADKMAAIARDALEGEK